MKIIKFRGKSHYSGKIIYGDLTHYGNKTYIDDEMVYEGTVSQLVGYDADGNEVYEDDILVHKDDKIICKVYKNYYVCPVDNGEPATEFLKNWRVKQPDSIE